MDAPRRLKSVSILASIAVLLIFSFIMVFNDRVHESEVSRLGSATLLKVKTHLSPTVKTRLSPTKRADINATNAIAQDFPDPSILKYGDSWIAFGTTNGKGINVQVATSPDFSTWEVIQGYDALPKTGDWSDRGPVLWAPDININDYGQFVLYYAARMKGNTSYCVGAGLSYRPTGPFTPLDEPIACHTTEGGAIDPSGFRDSDGQRYLLYKVDGNHIGNGGSCNNEYEPIIPTPIILQAVQADGVTPLGSAYQILDRSERDGPLVEAPSLVRTPAGKYVLFFSSNCFTSKHYDISYAFADSIFGPYEKLGPLAKTGTAGLRAPGGADIDPDGQHMVFHANGPKGRYMYTASININSDTRVVT